MLVQPNARVSLMLRNLRSLVRDGLLSIDAAAGCLSLMADSHSVPNTVFNRMQSAGLLCDLLGELRLASPDTDVRYSYFTQSTAHFTRILPQVIADSPPVAGSHVGSMCNTTLPNCNVCWSKLGAGTARSDQASSKTFLFQPFSSFFNVTVACCCLQARPEQAQPKPA